MSDNPHYIAGNRIARSPAEMGRLGGWWTNYWGSCWTCDCGASWTLGTSVCGDCQKACPDDSRTPRQVFLTPDAIRALLDCSEHLQHPTEQEIPPE